MRLEDNMMTVLTGLVFAVVLGTTVQNSDSLMSAFGAKTEVQADDDVFFVRAGTTPTLDVLANDYASVELTGKDIRILSNPMCGEVVTNTHGITYMNSASCEGRVSFRYCLGEGDACKEADVSMNVRPAPMAVADAYLPEKGDLVPLPLSHFASKGTSRKHRPEADQATQLNAFVVTIASQPSDMSTNLTEITRYLVNSSVADLQRTPSSDPSQLVDLRSINVPLSATRTARFLANYPQAALNSFELGAVDDTLIIETDPSAVTDQTEQSAVTIKDIDAIELITPTSLTQG